MTEPNEPRGKMFLVGKEDELPAAMLDAIGGAAETALSVAMRVAPSIVARMPNSTPGETIARKAWEIGEALMLQHGKYIDEFIADEKEFGE